MKKIVTNRPGIAEVARGVQRYYGPGAHQVDDGVAKQLRNQSITAQRGADIAGEAPAAAAAEDDAGASGAAALDVPIPDDFPAAEELRAAGFVKLAEVDAANDDELDEVENVGPATIVKMRSILDEMKGEGGPEN